MQQQYKDFTYVTSWGYYCCHCKSYSKESCKCLLQFLSFFFSWNCFSFLIISHYLNLIWMCNMMSANLMDTPFKMSVHSYINILEDEWMQHEFVPIRFRVWFHKIYTTTRRDISSSDNQMYTSCLKQAFIFWIFVLLFMFTSLRSLILEVPLVNHITKPNLWVLSFW